MNNDSTQKPDPVALDSNIIVAGDTTKTLMISDTFSVLRHPPDTARIIVRYRLYYSVTKAGDHFCETSLTSDTDHDVYDVSIEVFSQPNFVLAYTLFPQAGTGTFTDLHSLDMVPYKMELVGPGNL